jgi:predicted GH43/DUF377 family glycosyl hydrolase
MKTQNNRGYDLFKRYKKNPILTAGDWPYRVNAVFNPGAILHDNHFLLLVRVEELTGLSHLTVARSADGKTGWNIDKKPTFMPEPNAYPEEVWGVEDPRLVFLGEIKEYAVTYTAFSQLGPLVSLALTRDFITFNKQGSILYPDNKDASLFPKRFGDRWALLHRPTMIGTGSHIWLSYSPDLKHWGDHNMVIATRSGGWWDNHKIGIGPQPIETPEGWLIIYHGVRKTASSWLYRVGLALLDLEDPSRVIRRGDSWILGPRESYECIGDVPYVTFPCGVILEPKTNELYLYYGAADMSVALATASLKDVLDYLQKCPVS